MVLGRFHTVTIAMFVVSNVFLRGLITITETILWAEGEQFWDQQYVAGVCRGVLEGRACGR